MQHSDSLTVRFKILNLKYNISKRQTEELNIGRMDSAFECLELKRNLDFILHIFDDVSKIEPTSLLNIDIKYNKKEHLKIIRILKLIKLKYNI